MHGKSWSSQGSMPRSIIECLSPTLQNYGYPRVQGHCRMVVPSRIDATVQHLARNERYETEKPYAADFEVNEQTGAQKTNHIFSAQRVWINTIEVPDDFDIDTHGFCVIKAKTDLKPEDALNKPQEVESAYLNEVKAILHRRFPEYSRFEGIDFVVSTCASHSANLSTSRAPPG